VGDKRKYARQEKMKDKLFGNKSSDGCCAQLIPSISSSQSKETETKGNNHYTKTEIIFYISFRNVL
jgi:hypothetical protein